MDTGLRESLELLALHNPTVALAMPLTAPLKVGDAKLAFTRRGDLRINPSGVLETGSGHMVQS
jgi:hypothetical protein